jgi:hypothetical protein
MVKPRIDTGTVSMAKVSGERSELRGDHETAGAHHDEHGVHEPEWQRSQHFRRSVVSPALACARRNAGNVVGGLRCAQHERGRDDDDALAEAKR